MRARTLLGALSAAALLAACSSDPVGPLGSGGVKGAQCSLARIGVPITMGIYELHNTGTSTVTVQNVTLPGASGLTMTKAWLVPIGQTSGGGTIDVGAGWPYPPSFTALVRAVWAQRRPAVGAAIKPGQDLNLVFGLTRTMGSVGKSDGPAITYTAAGSTYTVQEKTGLVVAAANCEAPGAAMHGHVMGRPRFGRHAEPRHATA